MKIINKKIINDVGGVKITQLDIFAPDIAAKAKPGQFIMLMVNEKGERIPLTLVSTDKIKGLVSLMFQEAGFTTKSLGKLNPGDTLYSLVGPLGHPTEIKKFGKVILVGGGVGIAPLRSLIYALLENPKRYKRVSIKYGARMPEELCFKGQYDGWAKTAPNVDFTHTIDVPAAGWTGRVGLVTTLLDKLDIDLENSIAVSCGPEIMLKFVTLKLLEVGYEPTQIYLSMNRKMSCGMGKCGRCNVGHYYLCIDGPDMCYDKIKHVPNVFG